ncbi:MAG: SCO family protein [Hyphomicrobiales bacterium]
MKSVSRRVVLCLAMTAGFASPALAHSLKELEQSLREKDKYFQAVDTATPDFTLQDASGKTVRWRDFRGKVIVLNFIYANCPDFCPLHAEKIAEIQKMVNLTPMKSQVQFISITTDPKRDRDQVLSDYGENHGLDPVNWTFLTTTPEQPEDTTRKLVEAYGHKFIVVEGDEQMHGIVTQVIDQEGRLRARFHSLRFEPVSLVMYVNALVNKLQLHGHEEQGFWDRLKGMF